MSCYLTESTFQWELGLGMHEFFSGIRAIYTRCDLSDERIHLRKILYEGQPTRHKILNEECAVVARP
ncbi:hypothetical protein Y032_0009g589 [Ancylostoma ceylanicum]|uniref:Uncharacterized protein n=1 Tax=Ancylostoma ceylanicum TaxID=53326 RepID=A0A016VKD3_9BILA|nr:hypothetical protein Y032_0009g589 [Ancylostoma ceylanicum]